MPDLSLHPAQEGPAAELHAAFGAAFADYLIGPFTLGLDQWPVFLGRQCIDLRLSRVARVGGAIVAFALTAPRPDQPSWRLGTMGALPAARGSGAAQALLDDFIARAAAAGQQRVELECFAQNERGLRLYRSRGFEVIDELHGWQGRPQALADDEAAAVPLDEAFDWLAERAHGLPLQVTPAALRALPAALAAWRLGGACAVTSVAADRLTVHSLVDDDVESQRDALRLLRHLAALHPDCQLMAPQLMRPRAGGVALAAAGLERMPLHQLWMRLRLSGRAGPAATSTA